MSDKDREKLIEAYRLLVEAEPDRHVGSFFGCIYSIKYPQKQYELLRPFFEGFTKHEFQVGKFSFSRDERIFGCYVLKVEGSNEGVYLCFRNEDDFHIEIMKLFQCLTTLNLFSYRISLNTILKRIKEG